MTDLHNWVLEDIGKSKCDIQLSKKELKIDFSEYLCRFKKYINGDNGLKIAAWIKYTQPRIQGSFRSRRAHQLPFLQLWCQEHKQKNQEAGMIND